VPIYFQTVFRSAFTDQLKRAAEDDLAFENLRKPLSNVQIVTVTGMLLDGI
jgi:hypothetical protein